MRLTATVVMIMGVTALVAGCAEVNSAVDQANATADTVSVCAEALSVVDLNPLDDPAQLKADAEEKAQRLGELAGEVANRDVASSLEAMADSYVAVQKERVEDLTDAGKWAQRHLDDLDSLRAVCA